MKKRSKGNGRSLRARQRKALEAIAGRGRHKRRMWTFEQLEERHYLSATTLPNITPIITSSATADGMQQVLMNEAMWAALEANPDIPMTEALAQYSVSLPDDPYLSYQWHLINTGQEVGNPDWQDVFGTPGEDIHVLPAWSLGYTGEGVYVAVVDTGVQSDHPDLAANVSDEYGLYNPGTPLDPHGTAVAGLIGAVGNNDVGMTGVAYDATLVPIYLIGRLGAGEDAAAEALRYENQVVDIYNNSWGPDRDLLDRAAWAPTAEEALALRDGVIFGRDGLGSIYVFASGNSAGPTFPEGGLLTTGYFSSAQYNGWVNSRYTIGVGGIDADGHYNNVDGTITTYPEASAAILVAAPTGSVPLAVGRETGTGSGVWTTDLTGDDGYNYAPLPNGYEQDRDYFADTDYTSRFNGTSASAPLVSGVIALMLQANPNLSWRDVQEILVRSARQADIEDPSTGGGVLANQQSWMVNYRDFFKIPDPIETTPVGLAFDGLGQLMLLAPTPTVTQDANPTYFPDNLLFSFESPGTIVIPPVIGDPDADPAVPGSPGQVRFTNVYELPYAPMYSNGAGYTVSAGRGSYGDEYGYGHGVVDAGLAVKLASQWTTADQTLRPELTFTQYGFISSPLVIKAGQIGDDPLNLLVPGAFGTADSQFIDFWNEYLNEPTDDTDGPFSDENGWDGGTPGGRGAFMYFKVPDYWEGQAQTMKVESVEVKLHIANASADLNNVRLTLVSPDGTQSELIDQFPRSEGLYSLQEPSASVYTVGGLEAFADGDFTWTFSTNRNWGERSDNQYVVEPPSLAINPDTDELYVEGGTPLLDDAGTPFDPTDDATAGTAVQQGWRLIAENYSGTDINVDGFEIVWHGSPIDPESERIQGMVGVDAGYEGDGVDDDQFSFSRFSQHTEPGAANVTVVATLMEDGVATSQTKFITGADGNFYFDLLPPGPDNEYVITIQDPEGRTAKDDTNTQVDTDGSGTLHDVLPLYQQEWHITDDWFYRPDGGYVPVDIPNSPDHPYGSEYYYAAYQNYPDVNFRVYDDGTGTPVHFQDVNGELPSGPDYINFLLAPDASSAANETVVSGQVYADLEGDGAFNNDDAPAAGFIVYADTNHTGMFETTDTYTVTDQTGHYELHIPATVLQGMYIGAEAPSESWQQTAPDGGFLFTYIGAGQGPYEDMDFGFQPVTIPEPPTPPSPEKVSIIGTVFNDSNGNHVRGLGEGGASNFRVYVDSNDNGQLDWTDANGNGLYDEGEGENWAPTAENGAFFLANVDAPDLDPDPNAVLRVVTVRVETDAQWEVTVPVGNAWEVELPLTGTVSGLLFGVHNLATSDYGDLPDSFNYAPDGTYSPPSHVILPGFRLGTHDPDGEIGPQPSPTATGDDAVNDDEDGVQIMTTAVNPNGILLPGSANDGRTVLQVTVAGVGGLLTGWIDFNGDGHFSSDEKLTWKDPEGNLVQEVDLNPGTYQLPIDVPSDVAVGQLGARFRWGPAGLNYYGPASVGEVEDYFFDPPVVQPSQVPDGDFNGDGTVDEGDYNLWKATFHSTTDLRADGNGDGVVDAADYTIWRDHNGEAAGAGASVTTTSHTASSYSSSYDWQYDDGSADVSFEDIDPEFVAYMRSLGFDFRLVRVGLNGSQLMMYRPDVVADGSSTADAALVTDATLETELDWPGVQVGASSTSSPGLVQSPASTSPEDSLLSLSGLNIEFARATDSSGSSALLVTPTVVQDGTTATANLQLLDEVLGQIASRVDNDQVDEPFATALADGQQDSQATDLALAAVFEDEAPWWLSV